MSSLRAFTYPIVPIYIREYQTQSQTPATSFETIIPVQDSISKAILNITQIQTSKPLTNGDTQKINNAPTEAQTLDQMKISLNLKRKQSSLDIEDESEVNQVKENPVTEEKKVNGTSNGVKKFRNEEEIKPKVIDDEFEIVMGSEDEDDDLDEEDENDEDDEDDEDDEEDFEDFEDEEENDLEEDENELILDDENEEEVTDQNVNLTKVTNIEEEKQIKDQISKLLENEYSADSEEDEIEESKKEDTVTMPSEVTREQETTEANDTLEDQEVVDEQVVANNTNEVTNEEVVEEEVIDDDDDEIELDEEDLDDDIEDVSVPVEPVASIYDAQGETVPKPDEYDPADSDYSLKQVLTKTPLVEYESALSSHTDSQDDKVLKYLSFLN